MKTKITSLITAGILGTSLASQGALVLYQSDFTGTTLADAGLESTGAAGGIWDIDTGNDRLRANLPGGNYRATVNNENDPGGYGLDPGYKGFTLDVTFNQLAAADKFSIGLVDANAPNWNFGNDFIQDGHGPGGSLTPYSFGFSTDGPLENANGDSDVLSHYNGSAVSTLSDAQGDITFGQDTRLVLTITADSWSYSLNGAAPTTGAGSFDMSKSYMFVAFVNRGASGAGINNSYISNITLSQVPEPSSTALLGLGGLALMLRRKRS